MRAREVPTYLEVGLSHLVETLQAVGFQGVKPAKKLVARNVIRNVQDGIRHVVSDNHSRSSDSQLNERGKWEACGEFDGDLSLVSVSYGSTEQNLVAHARIIPTGNARAKALDLPPGPSLIPFPLSQALRRVPTIISRVARTV